MLSLPSPSEPMQPGQQRRVLATPPPGGAARTPCVRAPEQPSSRERLRNFRGMPEETRNPLTLAFPPSLRYVSLRLHVHASTTAHTPSVTAHGPPSGAIHGPLARQEDCRTDAWGHPARSAVRSAAVWRWLTRCTARPWASPRTTPLRGRYKHGRRAWHAHGERS